MTAGRSMIRRQFVDGPFGQLHVRTAGRRDAAKPPMVLIHQSPSSSVTFETLMPVLAADRFVLATDTPGYGESDVPRGFSDAAPPAISDYARAHGAAADALGLAGPLDVMGYFTGAKIACELALQRPRQVRRLILFGAPIYTPEELAAERATYAPDVYTWDMAHLIKWWDHLKRGAPPGYPISLFVRHFAEIQRGGPKSWWGHNAAFDYDFAQHLPKLGLPVLVMRTDDPQGAKTERARPLLKSARFVVLPYMAQGLLDLHTAEVAGQIRAFLDAPAPAGV
jgi:pimeloyl-ACP methyl ester carboxylesterase